MILEDITLGAREGAWRLFMVRKADPAFLAFQEKVFARDHNTCQYCGFQAHSYMEVVNLDGNYHNNRISNLVTACPFCAQCFFLDAIGRSDFGGGTLIVAPEMKQGEVSALAHTLFSALIIGGPKAQQAKTLYRSLRIRAQAVEKVLGEGMSNPGLYGHLLIDSNVDDKSRLSEQLSTELRLLPQFTRFVKQIERWQLDGFKALY